jgi:hypothetical protein
MTEATRVALVATVNLSRRQPFGSDTIFGRHVSDQLPPLVATRWSKLVW